MLRAALITPTFRPDRKRWRDALERQSEHRLWTWRRFSAELKARADVRDSDVILQEGLPLAAFPPGYRGTCALYLQGVLSMILDNDPRFDCSMWPPPDDEIAAWFEGEQRVLRRADVIFIGSQFLEDILVRRYGVPASKIVYAGTGSPPLPDAAPAPYARSQVMLFVGKDFERKGGEVLVRAFDEVVQRFPDARLQIVGPHKVTMPLRPGIEFLGRINDRSRLEALYRDAAVMVMPSLHESFGFVFLEAMSRGLPCIGTRMFAMPEITEDGHTGLLVEPNDVHGLALAVIRILADPEAAAHMGKAGRERLESHFTWPAVGRRILDRLSIETAKNVAAV
jgi:glycosyltransferase involved in cell wall biosynthesis